MRNGLPPNSFSRAPDAEDRGHPNKPSVRVSTLASAKSGGDGWWAAQGRGAVWLCSIPYTGRNVTRSLEGWLEGARTSNSRAPPNRPQPYAHHNQTPNSKHGSRLSVPQT